jgi:predicted nucleic acid-binding protein
MNIALDSNVLLYAEGIGDAEKKAIADWLAKLLSAEETYISVQVVGELYNVLVKRGRSRERAQAAALFWYNAFSPIATAPELMLRAIELATQHRLKIWDALILSAAAEANCSVLLSEDFQDGFAWRGVTVCNPFAAKPHPLVADLLRE